MLPDIASTGISRRRERRLRSVTPLRSSRKARSASARPLAPACAALRSSSASIRSRHGGRRPAIRRLAHARPEDRRRRGPAQALTGGRGVDVAIEALGRQETFERRCARPGLAASCPASACTWQAVAPYEALYAGLGDQRIVTTLCPGGKERLRRLMAMVAEAGWT